MTVLRYISAKLTKDEVWFLAKHSKTGSIEDIEGEKMSLISFQAFIRALRRSIPEANQVFIDRANLLSYEENKNVFNDLDSDCSEEIDEEVVKAEQLEQERLRNEAIMMKCSTYDPLEQDSFINVEDGYEEVTVIEEQKEEVVVEEEGGNEDDEEELNVVGPIEISEGWTEGKFEVNINRCHDCHAHFDYTRHSEDQFIDKFNEIGDAIIGMFANATIIGNYERTARIDEFEVYLRGIGFKSERDNLGRFFLFAKSQRGRMPEKQDILDQLICLSLIYGDS